eukprot:SAG31_NODE_178_length_21247_cov_11.492009_14_plen_280_part_00
MVHQDVISEHYREIMIALVCLRLYYCRDYNIEVVRPAVLPLSNTHAPPGVALSCAIGSADCLYSCVVLLRCPLLCAGTTPIIIWQANYYGCGSSNHLELMQPYFETIYSLHSESKARARSPDWSKPGHTPKPSLGANVYAFECGTCADQDVIPTGARCGNGGATGCPKIGNFSGIAVVNGIGPFAFQRLYHDDSNRFGAALASTPMKQYYEYSMDPVFLAECYPWLRDTAEFYRTYVVRNSHTGKFDIPHACGEEGCVLRNSAGACPHSIQERQAKNPM